MLCDRFADLLATIRTHPQRPAIVGPTETLSFGRLGRRIGAIHAALADMPDGPVLIHGHKEPDIVATMIAAALAGRAFVFADISYPATRLAQIIATCDCAVRVRTGADGPAPDGPALHSADLPDRALPDLTLSRDDEARVFYFTFTSGSTGVPKGIIVTRANFAAFQNWFEPQNTGSAGGAHAHVSHASFAFDMSMSDIWTCLFAGRTLIILPHGNNLNPRANVRQMARLDGPGAAGTLAATPAFFSLMLEDARFNATTLPHLRAFWIGGEAVQRALLQRLAAAFPKAQIYHAYGPSEATCITHSRLLTRRDLLGDGPLPLGHSFDSCTTEVITYTGPQPRGAGEVRLSGAQITHGYLPRDHAANAAFGCLPGGQRFYRTGDHGSIDDTNGLLIRGRIDAQVKINGFRVETGAIEAVAMGVPDVTAAVAMAVEDNRALRLVLTGQGGDALIRAVRAALKEALPPHMVPRDIMLRTSMPLNTSGKIDRRALAQMLEQA